MTDRPDPDPGATDYYGLVGVAREASQSEVDSALTRAKGQYHPDQSPLDESTANRCFDRVRDAETVLGDPERRAAYDTFLDRFGPESGHAEFETWADEGELVDPADWNAENGDTDQSTGPGVRDGDRTRRTGQTGGTTASTDTQGSTRTGSTARETAETTRHRQASSRRSRRGSTGGTQRRASTGAGRQGGTAATREATRQESGQGDQRAREYGVWVGPLRAGVVRARDRAVDGPLGVFAPAGAVLNSALDVTVVPGVYARRHVPPLAQVGFVSGLTVTAHGLFQVPDPVVGLAGLLVLVLATPALYFGGLLVWSLATALAYLAEGFTAPFYLSLSVLAFVALYALLAAVKADRILDTPAGG